METHQGEIEKLIVDIGKTVSVLTSFKKELDGFKHLGDIDKMWSDYKKNHNEVPGLLDALSMSIYVSFGRCGWYMADCCGAF